METIDPFGKTATERACRALGIEWKPHIEVFFIATSIDWVDLVELDQANPEDPDGEYPILGAEDMLVALRERQQAIVLPRGYAFVGIADRSRGFDEPERTYTVIDLTKDHEREGPTLHDAAERVCQHTPEGFEIALRIDHGSASVELCDQGGNSLPLPDAADKSIAEQLNDALCVVNGWPRPENDNA